MLIGKKPTPLSTTLLKPEINWSVDEINALFIKKAIELNVRADRTVEVDSERNFLRCPVLCDTIILDTALLVFCFL